MYLTGYYAFLYLAKYVELRTVNRQLFANIHELKTACAKQQIQLKDSWKTRFYSALCLEIHESKEIIQNYFNKEFNILQFYYE